MKHLYIFGFYGLGTLSYALELLREENSRRQFFDFCRGKAWRVVCLNIRDQIARHSAKNARLYRLWLAMQGPSGAAVDATLPGVPVLVVCPDESSGGDASVNPLCHPRFCDVIYLLKTAGAGTSPHGDQVTQTSLVGVLSRLKGDYLLVSNPDSIIYQSTVPTLLNEAKNSGADLVYCDQDFATDRGRTRPFFKPAFDPILLEQLNYIGDTFLIRRSILIDILTSIAPENYSIHQWLLAATGRLNFVARVPRILVSSSSSVRRSSPAIPPKQDELYARANPNPSTSVVIPTRNQPLLLERNIDALMNAKIGVNEIVIVNNGVDVPATCDTIQALKQKYENIHVVEHPGAFNWSAMNNHASSLCSEDVLVFMNDDMLLVSEEMPRILARNFENESIGVVGARLWFPNDCIQHAGLVLGYGGIADHVYRGTPKKTLEHLDIFPSPSFRRTVSAVTGAFFAVKSKTFKRLGGFDDQFPNSGDLHFCLRAANFGLSTVYDPRIELIHYESMTRKSAHLTAAEETRLKQQISAQFGTTGDPYYNSNLSLKHRNPVFYP